jgi:hypothetical protein
MNQAHAVSIKGEQYWIGARRYDVGVYRVGERFYATWFCDPCSTLKETPECDSSDGARQAAVDAIHGHHRDHHAVSR